MARRTLSQLGLNVQAAPLAWARIGSIVGASSDVVYVDSRGVKWRCVQWTAGTGALVLTVPGLVDMLVVGGSARHAFADGARLVSGVRAFADGRHVVIVGNKGAAGGGSFGESSWLGGIQAGAANIGTTVGLGACADASQTTGFMSSITGATVEYSRSQDANTAPGTGGITGQNGIVVVRVPV